MTTSADHAILFLRMAPEWGVIDDLRRFVESFCAQACPGTDREWQVGLAAHELVQNAIANAAGPDIEVKLELDGHAGRVHLAVTNACQPEKIDLLRARLARAQAHQDPLAGYLETMDTDPDGRGGLGLARIPSRRRSISASRSAGSA